MKTTRQYYAGHSYMGTNFTYDSPCWKVYAFDTQKARNKWVSDNEYNGQNYVAEAISSKIAMQIIGATRSKLSNGYYIDQNDDGSIFLR